MHTVPRNDSIRGSDCVNRTKWGTVLSYYKLGPQHNKRNIIFMKQLTRCDTHTCTIQSLVYRKAFNQSVQLFIRSI